MYFGTPPLKGPSVRELIICTSGMEKGNNQKFNDGLKLARLQPTRAEQNNSHLREM